MTDGLEVTSRSLDQTMALGARIARLAEPGDAVALVGELGVGKTQFVRGMAEGLGIPAQVVSSPTFVIMHEYMREVLPGLPGAGVALLVHIDAYRLNGAEELNDLAIEDVRGEAVLAVEWADRVMPALGDDVLLVEIAHTADGRQLRFTPRGRWAGKIGTTDEWDR